MAFDPTKFLPPVSSRNAGDCDDACGNDTPTEELTYTPNVLFFGYEEIDASSDPQTFTITNTGTLPVGISNVSVDGDFSINVGEMLPVSLAPGDDIQFQITFTPSEDGARVGKVTVDASLSDAPCECVHLIGVGGGLVSEIEALRTQIAALANLIGADLEDLQDIVDQWTGGAQTFTWRAYASSSDGSVDFTTNPPNGQTYLGLAFNKLVPTPSQDPDDYEWSHISGGVTNFVSQDTISVGGMPSWQVLEILADLANQLLNYQFDRQTLLDYVNAALFVDGVPINTVISQEQIQRQTADMAIAETISLIGAKTPDGSAFIIDLNKTMVSPTMSLGVRLTNLVAGFEDTTASIQNLQEAIAEADYASVSDLSLLGAKTLDGEAWIMDMAHVLVDEDGTTLAQFVSTAVAEAAGSVASVTQLYEALVTPEGTASAKALLQLDVNGHVVGYAATNDGSTGDITFTFDSFTILHPGSNAPIFQVIGDTVRMTNVEIDTLKVGSVTSDALASGAVQKLHWEKLAAAKNVPQNQTQAVFSLTFNKKDADSLVEIMVYGQFSTTDDIMFQYFFRIDGLTQTPTQRVNLILAGTGSNASMPLTPFAFLENLAVGNHTVEFMVKNTENQNRPLVVAAGAVMKVTELRKGAV